MTEVEEDSAKLSDAKRPSRRRFLNSLCVAVPAVAVTPVAAQAAKEKRAHTNELTTRSSSRKDAAYAIRVGAARKERAIQSAVHVTNGDVQRYPNGLATFTKCLPHNDYGEADPGALQALRDAVARNTVTAFEALPSNGSLRLTGSIGGTAFNIEGPDAQALGVQPPHAFSSLEFAGNMVELYWMALLRDVPFAEYGTSPLVAEAIADLSRFPEYDRPKGASHHLTPDTLFSAEYNGVLAGPRVSQFLLNTFDYDGVSLEQRIRFPTSVLHGNGIEFLTSLSEWLAVQRGLPAGSAPGDPRIDSKPRYILNMRDLGWAANESSVVTTYLKAAFILLPLGRDALDDANPYRSTRKVAGLGAFDFSHLLTLLGQVAVARHFAFLKWHHCRLRPEAFGGRLHHHLAGNRVYPIHEALLASPALDKIRTHNAQMNERRGLGGGNGTYLLPCLFGSGCPTHPSFPAGHGTAAGLGVTLLKAWFKEDYVLPDAITNVPTEDGTQLRPYRAGVDGPPLTIGAELNKLAHNITWGRNMSGIHYRDDGIAGNTLGEEIALRLLRESRKTYGESFDGFTLTRFDGRRVTI